MNAKKSKTKFSKLRLRNNISNSPNEKISSYFPKLSQENYLQDDNVAQEENRSKSAPVSLEINDSIDEKDFITKKPTRQLKLFMCDKRKKKEDIELAIALSKSVEEQQEPSTSDSGELLRKTLEKYGFKSSMKVQHIPKPLTYKRKKKFIRTVLFIRTEEDRANIIQDKISEIMNNIEDYNEHIMKVEENETKEDKNELMSDKPSSFMLRDMYDSDSTLFKKSALNDRKDEIYFNSLVDQKESSKMGSLLRDWHNIPGREKTPPREHSKTSLIVEQNLDEIEIICEQKNEIEEKMEVKNGIEENSELKNRIETNFENKNGIEIYSERNNELEYRSESPELFSDDDATYERNINPDKLYKSKIFESPIKHYESFNDAVCFEISSCSDELFPDQDEADGPKNCVDLTQTSEESNDANIKNDNIKTKVINEKNDLKEMEIDFEETKKSEIDSEEMKIHSIRSEETDNIEISEIDSEKNKNSETSKKNFIRSNSFSGTNQNLSFTVHKFHRSQSEDVKNLSKSVLDEIDEMIDNDNEKSLDVIEKKNDDTLKNCEKLIQNHSELFSNNTTKNSLKNFNNTICNESQESILCESGNELNKSQENNNLNKTNQLTNIDLTLSSDDERENDSVLKDPSASIRDFQPSLNASNIFVLSDTESENDDTISRSSKNEQKSYKFIESCIKKIDPDDQKILSQPVDDTKIKSFKFNESCIKKKSSSGSDSEQNQNLSQSDNYSSISLSSDEELNYSSNVSFMRKKKLLNRTKKDFDENSVDIDENIEDIQNYMDIDQNIDDIENFKDDYQNFEENNQNLEENNLIDLDDIESDPEENNPWAMDHFEYPHSVMEEIDQIQDDRNKTVHQSDLKKTETPNKIIENIPNVPSMSCNTPDNLIVKTVNVTPMPNYTEMDTPDRHKELEKFGLKPMKKPKSVKILEYIYNATHPIASNKRQNDDIPENSKRRKLDKKQKFVTISNSQVRRRQIQKSQSYASSDIKILGDEIANCESVEDMIFEKKYSAKIKTCRIPFHIVWHNFVSSQPELLENILLYEPLQIEEIHLKIKKLGYNFDIQDLISFMDKKCITIRTNQNSRLRKKQCDSSS